MQHVSRICMWALKRKGVPIEGCTVAPLHRCAGTVNTGYNELKIQPGQFVINRDSL